jgi:hypothetical protein
MQPRILTVPAALAVLVLAAARPAPPPPCLNVFPHEPVLFYEVSGFTLCCLVDQQLAVYGDGSVRISRATYDGANSKSQLAYVGTGSVQALVADLGALGAGSACDDPAQVSDVPLSTLTMMRGETDGRAHTFSWLHADGTGGAVAARLDAFVAATFPGF